MVSLTRVLRGIRFAALISSVMLVAACANNPNAAGPNGAGDASVPGSAQDFVVNVGDRVFFNSDSTELTPQSRTTLDKQATWLNQYGRYNFTVEGHADERGTREYNLALGARRANVTRDYLVSRGVAPQRIRVISYGKERPVAVCNDISCWSQNRRAVTVLNTGAASY